MQITDFKLQPKIVNPNQSENLQVMLDNITVLLSGDDTDGKMFFGQQIIQPGDSVPPHYHEREDEIITLIEGELEVYLDGAHKRMKAGDTIFLPKFVPHGYKVISDTPVVTRFCVHPSGLENMFRELAVMEPLEDGSPNLELAGQICASYGCIFVQPEQ